MIEMLGTRCRLRPITRADLAQSIIWRNDTATRQSVLGYPFPVTEEMEAAWYEQLGSEQGTTRASFAIEDSSDAVLAGFVHLTEIDWIVRSTCCSLSSPKSPIRKVLKSSPSSH